VNASEMFKVLTSSLSMFFLCQCRWTASRWTQGLTAHRRWWCLSQAAVTPFCCAHGTLSSRLRQREETVLPQAGDEHYCMGWMRRFHCRCPSRGGAPPHHLWGVEGVDAVFCPWFSDLLYCWEFMT